MKEPRSHCCLAKRKEVSGHEGTGYFVCWACGEEFIDESEYCLNCKRHEGETCEFCESKPKQGDLSPDGKASVAMANIGLLRQWLNEDRITEPDKMVTNEELLKWLE